MRTSIAGVIAVLGALAACNSSPTGAAPAVAAELRVVRGGDQEVLAGYAADTIVVRVVDRFGHPVPDVEVAITAEPIASELSTSTATSDENGEIHLGWQPALALGAQQLQVTIPTAPSISALVVTATTVTNPVRAIMGTQSNMCAIDRARRLGCWDPSLGTNAVPTLHLAETSEHFRSLAVYGTNHGPRGCAVAETGRIWCFGFVGDGMIGELQELQGSYPAMQSVWSVGGETWTPFLCALDAGGRAWCWGDNRTGALGDGTTNDHDVPTMVSGSVVFSSLTLGTRMACGLTADGTAWCWGSNDRGVLGVPDGPALVLTPTEIPTALRFRSLAVINDDGVCGVAYSGGGWCWGEYWIRGNGPPRSDDPPPSTPRRIINLDAPFQIVANYLAVNAIEDGGNAWWWGNLPGSWNPPEPHLFGVSTGFISLAAPGGLYTLCGNVDLEGGVICLDTGRMLPWGGVDPLVGFGVPFPE